MENHARALFQGKNSYCDIRVFLIPASLRMGKWDCKQLPGIHYRHHLEASISFPRAALPYLHYQDDHHLFPQLGKDTAPHPATLNTATSLFHSITFQLSDSTLLGHNSLITAHQDFPPITRTLPTHNMPFGLSPLTCDRCDQPFFLDYNLEKMFTKNGGKPSGGWWCGCSGGVKRTQNKTDDLYFAGDEQERNKRRRMSTNRKPLTQRASSTQRKVIIDDMGAPQSQRSEKRNKSTAMTRVSQTSGEQDTEGLKAMDNEQKSGVKRKQADLKNTGRVSSEWQHEKTYHSDSSETIDDEEHNGKKRRIARQHSNRS